ncbi:MAG: hypothetical protein HY692_09500, partial [Cyanobacteria bacterium NC_groundwater_1444_Ag_S-0.65um_54_12]|nr:hypothetical protein [Cyanobacteria bacterium NC_groundwater_1444_Ag_S-0.65um_54_12]
APKVRTYHRAEGVGPTEGFDSQYTGRPIARRSPRPAIADDRRSGTMPPAFTAVPAVSTEHNDHAVMPPANGMAELTLSLPVALLSRIRKRSHEIGVDVNSLAIVWLAEKAGY